MIQQKQKLSFLTAVLLVQQLILVLGRSSSSLNNDHHHHQQQQQPEVDKEEENEDFDGNNFSPLSDSAESSESDDDVLLVRLTVDNFYEATADKKVFIKFYDPMCGHCLMMADDWIDLADEFEDDDDILIGNVDCTRTKNKLLCSYFNVTGYPTLLYGHVIDLQQYLGQRDFVLMRELVEQELMEKDICSVAVPDKCDNDKQKLVKRFQNMNSAELDQAIADLDERDQEAQQYQKDIIDALEASYAAKIETTRSQKQEIKRNIQKLKKYLKQKETHSS